MNMNVLNIDSIDVEAGMRDNFEKIETKNNSESGCDRFLNRKYKCVIIYVMFIVFIAETLIIVLNIKNHPTSDSDIDIAGITSLIDMMAKVIINSDTDTIRMLANQKIKIE